MRIFNNKLHKLLNNLLFNNLFNIKSGKKIYGKIVPAEKKRDLYRTFKIFSGFTENP